MTLSDLKDEVTQAEESVRILTEEQKSLVVQLERATREGDREGVRKLRKRQMENADDLDIARVNSYRANIDLRRAREEMLVAKGKNDSEELDIAGKALEQVRREAIESIERARMRFVNAIAEDTNSSTSLQQVRQEIASFERDLENTSKRLASRAKDDDGDSD